MSEKAPSALRDRNFAFYWTGQTASITGNGVFRVALPLEVLHLTGNPFDLALVLTVDQLPTVLLLLIGGALVDRLSRRQVMLISDTVSGLSIALVAAAIASGHAHLWQLLILSFVFGVSTALYLPASAAIIPDILPTELLNSANSLISLSQSLGQYLVGPLAGGVIVATAGSAWAFGVDGITFLVSAACLAAFHLPAKQSEPSSSILAEVKVGLKYSRERRWLWWNMIAMGIANLAAYLPLFVILPLLVNHVFRAGSLALGTIYAASGVGGALASVYLKRRGAPRRRMAAMWVAMGIASLSVSLVGASPYLWLAVVFAGTLWGGVTYGNIIWMTAMQENVPPELLGRVSSLDLLLSIAMGPMGFLLGGAAANWFGARTTLVLGGAIALAAAGVAFVPGVLTIDGGEAVVDPEFEMTA